MSNAMIHLLTRVGIQGGAALVMVVIGSRLISKNPDTESDQHKRGRFLRIFGGILFVVTILSFGAGVSTLKKSQKTDWCELSTPNQLATLELPADPQLLPEEDGVKQLGLSRHGDEVYYRVSSSEIKAEEGQNPADYFKNSREKTLKKLAQRQPKLLSTSVSSSNTFATQQFTIDVGRHYVMRVKEFIAGKQCARLEIVEVISKKHSAETDRCFNSFKLLNSTQSSPGAPDTPPRDQQSQKQQ